MRPRPLCLAVQLAVSFYVLAYAQAPLSAQDETSFRTKERLSRIRDLGKRDSDSIAVLTPYLNDQNREIRLEAVKAIVKIGSERSLSPLTQATADNDPEIQIRATDGLVNFYQPGYVAKGALSGPFTRGFRQVRSFFSSRDDETIAPGVIVRPEVGQAIASLARSGSDFDSRTNAALAAGILLVHSAVPALTEALQSKKTELIFEALVALQKIGDPTAGPSITFLANDLDDRVQSTALETIGVLHSTSSAESVRQALSNARNQKIRRAALQSLAMLGLPADRSLFKDYVPDRDADLRASALEGLGRIREPEDYPLIEAAYNEKNADPKVHLAAAFALVGEGKTDTSEFSPLTYLINNLDSKSQASVSQTYLNELCHKADVRKAIFPLLPNATRDEKVGLIAALGNSVDPDVIPSLEALSKDIDPQVSLAASKNLSVVRARRL